MIITCPHCGFSREVPPERLPNGSVVATCPKCSCRFHLGDGKKRSEADARGEAATGRPGGVACEQQPEDGGGRSLGDAQGSGKTWTAATAQNGVEGEEDEDPRLRAAKAYEREAMRFAREEAAANPWDTAPGSLGWVGSFFQCVLRVMFSAPRFFAGLSPQAGQGRALVFYLMICVLQILVEHVWSGVIYSTFAPGAENDPRLAEMLELLQPQQNFVLMLLLRSGILVAQIYVCSLLMFFVYRMIVPQRASFALVFQVLAYSSAPALLCVVPALGTIAGLIWSAVCAIVGMGAALRLGLAQTILGFLPILFIFAPLVSRALNLLG